MNTTKIAIFYHCAVIGEWEVIDKEIMGVLKESGLLEKADLFIKNVCAKTDLYEFPTLEMIKMFAQYNDYKILYIHTKGATNNSTPVKDWRACMLHWLVERWEDCVNKLDEVDTVGIMRIDDPVAHYKGNFWWSKSSHIRKLDKPREAEVPILEANGRHKAEFWLLSKEGKHYCPYKVDNDPYGYKNDRVNYISSEF